MFLDSIYESRGIERQLQWFENHMILFDPFPELTDLIINARAVETW